MSGDQSIVLLLERLSTLYEIEKLPYDATICSYCTSGAVCPDLIDY